MITYINNELAEKYSTLFQNAAQIIGCSVEEVDTEKLVSNIGALISENTAFARLPVDEEVFEIDANTRTISIPKSFSKNGVGVVGDELAETVYFKINRYYDYADFDDMEVLIQWEAGGVQGISKAIYKDSTTDKDYLYFGWALTSALTQKSGNIKFNVRIIKRQNNTLLYSFATQQASLSVKNTLNLDVFNIQIDNMEQIIGERLMGATTASKAKILTDLENEAETGDVIEVEIEEPAAGTLVIYSWYKDGVKIATEHTSQLTINSIGEYYAIITTSIKVVEATGIDANGVEQDVQYHSSVEKVKSSICHVLAPVKVEITEQPAEQIIIGQKEIEITLAKPESEKASISCKAYKADTKDGAYEEVATLAFVQTATATGIKLTTTPTEAGYYKFVVINSMNGGTQETTTDIIRITVAPVKVNKPTILVNNKVSTTAKVGDTLKATFTETNGDSYIVNWYKETAQDVSDEDHSKEHTDTIVATGETYVLTEAGYYFVKVTTELNGAKSEESTMSKVISVMAE